MQLIPWGQDYNRKVCKLIDMKPFDEKMLRLIIIKKPGGQSAVSEDCIISLFLSQMKLVSVFFAI